MIHEVLTPAHARKWADIFLNRPGNLERMVMSLDTKNYSVMKLAQLLSSKSLQEELNFSSEQETNLRAAIGEIRQKFMEEIDNALTEILAPEQQKRLKEIRIQVQGLNAFADPEVQSQLQLADDQREQIRAILRDGFEEAKAFRESLS